MGLFFASQHERVVPKSSLRRFGVSRRQTNSDTESSTASTKKDKKMMLDFIQQPMESTVGDKSEGPTIIDPIDMEFVTTIVKAADGRKAEDIKVLYVGDVSTLTSFLIVSNLLFCVFYFTLSLCLTCNIQVLSGNSRPQNQAIVAAITDDVEEEYKIRPGGNGVPEGTAESGWMLLDYGSVMVHVMTPKSRLFYNVEGQWKDKGGEEVDVSHVLVPNAPVQTDPGSMDDGFVSEDNDPFWS